MHTHARTHTHTLSCLFKLMRGEKSPNVVKKNPNVYLSSGCHVGLLRRDTCHNHQDFFIPSGPQEAAKVKLFKGGVKGGEVSNGRQSQKIRSVKFKPQNLCGARSCIPKHACMLSMHYIQHRPSVYAKYMCLQGTCPVTFPQLI